MLSPRHVSLCGSVEMSTSSKKTRCCESSFNVSIPQTKKLALTIAANLPLIAFQFAFLHQSDTNFASVWRRGTKTYSCTWPRPHLLLMRLCHPSTLLFVLTGWPKMDQVDGDQTSDSIHVFLTYSTRGCSAGEDWRARWWNVSSICSAGKKGKAINDLMYWCTLLFSLYATFNPNSWTFLQSACVQ